MKNIREELDVDFIGGQGELTIVEEKLISDYIKQQKFKSNVQNLIKNKVKIKKELV